MLRNVPLQFNRQRLCDAFDAQGFGEKIDFVYLPLCFAEKKSLGYAFVNCINHDVARNVWNCFDGFRWGIDADRVLVAATSGTSASYCVLPQQQCDAPDGS